MNILTLKKTKPTTTKLEKAWYKLLCVSCGTTCSEADTTTRCLQCGGALDVYYNDAALKQRVDPKIFCAPLNSLLNYRALYPLPRETKYISLHEGHTPLEHLPKLSKKYGVSELLIKNESANPTGVFKDRGSLVEVTKAKQLGAKAICCASTGNMAASVSAYAAVANLPCFVFVPDGTPAGKLSQSLAYGAHIISLRGSYADCVKMCGVAAKSQGFYVAGDYAFRSEGQKTLAYEVYQQLNQAVPDVMIVPMGCGTNIASIFKGWKDLLRLGVIDHLPRLVGVQPDSVPTIVQAWKEHKTVGVHMEQVKSVASAVGIGSPLDDVKALAALYESNGYAITVPEAEIVPAQFELSHVEGIFVEPSSVLSVAAVPLLKKSGVIKESYVVVAVLTGSGLKDPQSIVSIMPKPHVLEPNALEVSRYFDLQMYNVRSSGAGSAEITWKTNQPTAEEVQAVVKTQFNFTLQTGYVEEVLRQLASFQEKTAKVHVADLQGIVETVLQEYYGTAPVLQVKDFEVHTQQHKPPLAWVKINFAGEELQEHAVGVGPVDAIVQALQKLLHGRDQLKTELTNYKVEINTGGTDAVVRVQLTLRDVSGTEVTGTSTSPDVIVASIQAFVSAYNILSFKATIQA
ncbi:MAG: hypothetical protein ACD_43C00039G0002 [uncultured bacterium]|nr:MAG: hypothetical protein ACD_43C00039G0002 [uncultured bacterium]